MACPYKEKAIYFIICKCGREGDVPTFKYVIDNNPMENGKAFDKSKAYIIIRDRSATVAAIYMILMQNVRCSGLQT